MIWSYAIYIKEQTIWLCTTIIISHWKEGSFRPPEFHITVRFEIEANGPGYTPTSYTHYQIYIYLNYNVIHKEKAKKMGGIRLEYKKGYSYS